MAQLREAVADPSEALDRLADEVLAKLGRDPGHDDDVCLLVVRIPASQVGEAPLQLEVILDAGPSRDLQRHPFASTSRLPVVSASSLTMPRSRCLKGWPASTYTALSTLPCRW